MNVFNAENGNGWGAWKRRRRTCCCHRQARIAHNGPSLIECIIDRDDCKELLEGVRVSASQHNITLDHFYISPQLNNPLEQIARFWPSISSGRLGSSSSFALRNVNIHYASTCPSGAYPKLPAKSQSGKTSRTTDQQFQKTKLHASKPDAPSLCRLSLVRIDAQILLGLAQF